MDYDSAMRAAKTEYDRWLSTSEPWLKRNKAGRPRGSGKRRTHCPNGHAYVGENLYIDNQGAQRCKCCRRAAHRKGQQARRMAKRLAA